MDHAFHELALLLLICAATGAVFVRLRQPVLIAYIAAGIAVGPAGFALVTAHEYDELAQETTRQQGALTTRFAHDEAGRLATQRTGLRVNSSPCFSSGYPHSWPSASGPPRQRWCRTADSTHRVGSPSRGWPQRVASTVAREPLPSSRSRLHRFRLLSSSRDGGPTGTCRLFGNPGRRPSLHRSRSCFVRRCRLRARRHWASLACGRFGMRGRSQRCSSMLHPSASMIAGSARRSTGRFTRANRHASACKRLSSGFEPME